MLTKMLLLKSTGQRISLLCNVTRNVRLFSSTPSEIPKKDQSASASLGGGGMNRNTHKVDNLERKMLVRKMEPKFRLLSKYLIIYFD